MENILILENQSWSVYGLPALGAAFSSSAKREAIDETRGFGSIGRAHGGGQWAYDKSLPKMYSRDGVIKLPASLSSADPTRPFDF